MEKIKIEHHTLSGGVWFAAWLFTIGYLKLSFWRGNSQEKKQCFRTVFSREFGRRHVLPAGKTVEAGSRKNPSDGEDFMRDSSVIIWPYYLGAHFTPLM